LNPRPADYKSAALPAELRQHIPYIETATNIEFSPVIFNDIKIHKSNDKIRYKKATNLLIAKGIPEN
jgi:hypothetical protein